MDEEGLYAMANCYVAPLALRSRYGSAGNYFRPCRAVPEEANKTASAAGCR
jgi:hypothetical protein